MPNLYSMAVVRVKGVKRFGIQRHQLRPDPSLGRFAVFTDVETQCRRIFLAAIGQTHAAMLFILFSAFHRS